MAALEIALVLVATVLVSAILDQVIPRLSLPLIQIALGVIIDVVTPEQINISLYPELFLVLFISPLLFREAREADKVELWQNRSTMLSYAIGLVVAIVLVVGFTAHWLVPSIPLAAAFALGAALGPTDPIAVSSVSQQAKIPDRLQATLKGESLINDASGIVSFQFAVAAVTTGAFSLADAVKEFFVSFFGALALGIVLGYLLVRFIDKMRDLGLEDTTFHVVFEICTPVIVYLLGELVGVSGIIMVVACGITMSMVPRDLGPAIARQNIVSSSVWDVLAFALNGIVFVLLGTQLPIALTGLWVDEGISNVDLIVYVFVITLLMHGTRFAWSLASDAMAYRRAGVSPTTAQRLRTAAITTFSGAKGTITLAIMLSIPNWVEASGGGMERFPQRDLLIFMACGVILLSLLLATFVVPLLAPRPDSSSETRERDSKTRIEIFRRVIEELTARQTPQTRVATSQVIARYNDRIARTKDADDIEDGNDDEAAALRVQVLQWEEEYVLDLIESDEVPPVEGYQYVSRLARIESMVERDRHLTLAAGRRLRRVGMLARKLWANVRSKLPGKAPEQAGQQAMRDIQLRTSSYIVQRLQSDLADSEFPTETVSELIVEYQRAIRMLQRPAPSITALARNAEPDLQVTRAGLRIELEQIQQAYEEGRLSRQAAQRMRENVYLMQVDLEDYL